MMGHLQVHTAPSGQQFLTKNGATPIPHPLYLSSLALSDFIFVSPDEKCFANGEEVKQKKRQKQ